MKTHLRKFLFALFIITVPLASRAQDLILAGNGNVATIVIGTNASVAEKYAADELKRAIKIMSGADLQIVSSGTSVTGTQIIIGTPDGNDKIDEVKELLHLTGTHQEQTTVLRQGNILYLGGQTPRAALFATYTLLDDILGVRWLWPGETGEFIPQKAIVSVGALSLFQIPDIDTRAPSITNVSNSNPATDEWIGRNKMNIINIPRNSSATSPVMKERLKRGFLTRIAGHFIVLPEDILRAHPDYVALYNGTRSFTTANTAQLCWGNVGVQNEVAEMLKDLWTASPFVDIIHFYPADNQTYCADQLCKNLAPDVSTRWQKFAQIVMEKADQTYPGKKYWTYAYQGFKAVPTIAAERYETIGYTLYEASYRHLLSSGYSGSAGAIAEIDGWLSKGANMGIRGYEYIMFRDPMFVPLVSWEVDHMKWMKQRGLSSYLSELPPFKSPQNVSIDNTYFTTNRMNLYTAAKASWNTDVTADSIVRDWCQTVYGPAATPMIAYYWDIENLWRSAPGDIQEYNKTPASEADNFLNPQAFTRLNAFFTEARNKLDSISDPVRKQRVAEQIELESKMLSNWQGVYNFKKNIASHYETAIEKADSLTEDSWSNSSKLPAFQNAAGEIVDEQTVVPKVWTNTDLHFRIVSQDNNLGSRVANATVHDGNVTADDCIELYFKPDPNSPSYMHLAVNTRGVKYDAKSHHGGSNTDITWDPDWTAVRTIGDGIWTVDIKIPFSSLGITAQDSTQFQLAVKRSRAGRADNSGWPDASYFNPAAFGTATLVSKIVDQAATRVILYDPGSATSGDVSTEFQQRGWQVVSGLSNEASLKEKLDADAAALIIRYGASTTMLSTLFNSTEVKKFLEKGRVVIVTTARSLPVHQWFPGVPAITWSGNNQNLASTKSTYQLPGPWQSYPNNLKNEVKLKPNPVTAYRTGGESWRILLKMPLKDGTDQPFLMTHRVGDGLLVVTSSNMGYSGGYEVFGSRNITNAVKLTENLIAERNTFPVTKKAQVINFGTLPQKVIGEPDFPINASSDSGLPVSLSSTDESVATVNNGIIHITGVGTTIFTATQPGSNTYEEAEAVSQEFVVVPDIVAPTTPDNLTAAVTDSTANLNWSASTDFIGVTGYNVYRNDEFLGSTTELHYPVTGLRPSQEYTFKVTAKDSAQNQSAPASVTVLTPDTQKPTIPLNLTADKTNKHKVELSWQTSADNVAVTGYNIYRNGLILNSAILTNTSYLAERPKGKDVYYFTVKALDAAGNISDASNTAVSANGNIKDQLSGLADLIQEEGQLEMETFNTYPNPSTGNFTLATNTSQNGKIEISVFNLSGTLMKKITDMKDGPYQTTVNLSSVPAGNYIVRVKVNSYTETKQILIDYK